MAWLRADDVFEAADAEDDALRPSPSLYRKNGPLRKPDEGKIKSGCGDSDLVDRLRHNAAKIREAEQALACAGPADRHRLTQSLSAFRANRERLLQSRRMASAVMRSARD